VNILIMIGILTRALPLYTTVIRVVRVTLTEYHNLITTLMIEMQASPISGLCFSMITLRVGLAKYLPYLRGTCDAANGHGTSSHSGPVIPLSVRVTQEDYVLAEPNSANQSDRELGLGKEAFLSNLKDVLAPIQLRET
jgi:hypothetical protein